MILGIIGLVTCLIFVPALLAFIFGLVAARQIKHSAGALKGSGLARAGWIMGLIGLLMGGGFWTLAATGALDDGTTPVFDVEAGECANFDFDPTADDIEVTTIEVVDCDEPHEAEVIFREELNPGGVLPYPSGEQIDELVVQCGNRVPDEVAPGVDLTDYSSFTVVPDEDSWDDEDGPLVCFAVPTDGGTATGSLMTGD